MDNLEHVSEHNPQWVEIRFSFNYKDGPDRQFILVEKTKPESLFGWTYAVEVDRTQGRNRQIDKQY
jgi:hypothetical protein